MGGNLYDVSGGFILGLLLFICDLFLFTNDKGIASYTDDSTPYVTLSKINLAIENLEHCFVSLHMISK